MIETLPWFSNTPCQSTGDASTSRLAPETYKSRVLVPPGMILSSPVIRSVLAFCSLAHLSTFQILHQYEAFHGCHHGLQRLCCSSCPSPGVAPVPNPKRSRVPAFSHWYLPCPTSRWFPYANSIYLPPKRKLTLPSPCTNRRVSISSRRIP